jgi:hypothetical protein
MNLTIDIRALQLIERIGARLETLNGDVQAIQQATVRR